MLLGKGKKDDDWSDEGSDVELKEVSEEEIAKPVTKKKGNFYPQIFILYFINNLFYTVK